MPKVEGHSGLHPLTAAALLFLFLVVGWAVFYPALNLFFVSDDFVWLSLAPDIRSDLSQLFALKISNFFMPVVYGYFAVLDSLFHLDPAPYHALSISIHILNSWLVALIVFELAGRRGLAVAGGLMFLLLRFPIDAVVWVSAVTMLLTALFLFSAGVAWLKYLKTGGKLWYILALASSVLLTFTKEWSLLFVPFLLVLTVALALRRRSELWLQRRKIAFSLLPFAVVILPYLFAELYVQATGSYLIQSRTYTFGAHIATNTIDNITLVFFPFGGFAHRHEVVWLFFSLAVLAVLVAVSLALWRWSRSPAFVGVVWMVAAFVPTAPFTWDPLVSRYAYLPAFGAVLFAVFILDPLRKYRWGRAAVLTFLALFLAANVLTIRGKMGSFYQPLNDEIRQFTDAAGEVAGQGQADAPIIFIDTAPVSGFILPDLMKAFYLVPPSDVRVVTSASECPEGVRCWQWSSASRVLEPVQR